MRTLLLIPLFCSLAFAESAKERQLNVDKENLIHDKTILEQRAASLAFSNEILKKQVTSLIRDNDLAKRQNQEIPFLRRQVEQLQTEIKSRPAVVTMPPAAQQSLDKASDRLSVTAYTSVSNNDLLHQIVNQIIDLLKTFSLWAVAIVTTLCVGFGVLIWFLRIRIDKDAQRRIEILREDIARERQARELSEKTLIDLLEKKGIGV